MEKINLGLQSHAVREAFAEDPVKAVERVAAMGYEGMELNMGALNHEPQFYADTFDRFGIKCFSALCGMNLLTEENLESTIATCKILGITDMVLGSVDGNRLKTEPDYPAIAIGQMNYACEELEKVGIRTGYHSHDMDSFRVQPNKSFYEMVMENTPDRFSMVIDTGNTMGGGDDPIALLKQFPGRSPILHIKGYSQAKEYTTPVWESEIDMDELLTTAIDLGGTGTMVIEFGKRGDYEPFDRAEKSLIWLKEQLGRLGRI